MANIVYADVDVFCLQCYRRLSVVFLLVFLLLQADIY